MDLDAMIIEVARYFEMVSNNRQAENGKISAHDDERKD